MRENGEILSTLSPRSRKNDYPTTDGKPMAETEYHRDLMMDLIRTLQAHFAAVERICVSGNMLLFYEKGNKRKHVSPDVFVVRGVEKRVRENYLVWEEGRGPEVVIELTSSSTRHEDQKKKYGLYQDVLKVREYFLFDPKGDYLKPQLKGYRLVRGAYRPIAPVEGRLPSQVLKLHLEQDGSTLRLWDPETEAWLPTPQEEIEQLRRQVEELRAKLGPKA